MSARQENALAAWAQTPEGQAVRRQHALANIELIRAMPRCGAKAKSTGQPCRQPGSGRGGRCVYHGGRSTAGDTWGLRQWSDHPSPVVARRQVTKAKWVERAEAEREARIAAMSPVEQARYWRWREAHAAGPQEDRVGAKLRLAMGVTPQSDLSGMSIAELQARIDQLRAEKRAWEAHCAIKGRLGVFG